MATAGRGARPCGARRSAGLTDRWTGSDRLREAEGEAQTSGACGGREGRVRGSEEAGLRGGERRPGPGGEEAGPRGRDEA